MSWIALMIAGCLEILGVIMLKKFTITGKKIFLLLIAVQFTLSFGFLGVAMREISMGTAYAIWTGIGAGGGVVLGVIMFNESKSLKKLFFIALILSSSIGLKLIS
ncbi:QacE family quaternary ammonium compound efflux SMR transporter [Campylobacter sp. faydin G-24]|uniref:Guanidinium exporter n=1 Tax=Campylobacter anatolicus TaxID=2829105 RepID=A0ABS5HGD5_9BACT|nr:SMR family transporter [Campylobacter anatolicus]MBR8463275.1 QacE family quaternary ammonium compound efflux SMR transporter [Campylobacter anatolicus]MBR8465411.1 QacE family quaternary ammonium compound efflux SMR transporter [Campylobacter anatolicus]